MDSEPVAIPNDAALFIDEQRVYAGARDEPHGGARVQGVPRKRLGVGLLDRAGKSRMVVRHGASPRRSDRALRSERRAADSPSLI